MVGVLESRGSGLGFGAFVDEERRIRSRKEEERTGPGREGMELGVGEEEQPRCGVCSEPSGSDYFIIVSWLRRRLL